MTNADWRIHERLNDYKTVYIYYGRGSGKSLTELNTILNFLDQRYSVVLNDGFKGDKHDKD